MDAIDKETDKDIVDKLISVKLDDVHALRGSGQGAIATRQFIVVSDMMATAKKMQVEEAGYQSILLTTTRVLQSKQMTDALLGKSVILSYFYEIAFEFNRWKHEMLVAIERQKKLDIKDTPINVPPPPPLPTTGTADTVLQWLIRAYVTVTGKPPPPGNIPLHGDYTKIPIGVKVKPTGEKYVSEKTYVNFRKKVDSDAAEWRSALALPESASWTRQRASFEYFNSQDPFVALAGNKAVSYMLDQDMRLDDILLFTTKQE
jgi:hypothetical protein